MAESGTGFARLSPATSGGLPDTSNAMWGVKMIKFCIKCGTDTNRDANYRCKPCMSAYDKAYYAANSEKIRGKSAAYYAENHEKAKIYYSTNSEKIREQSRARYAENPGKRKERIRAYQSENIDKIKAYSSAYRAANPDREIARHAAYRAANPEKLSSHRANRRARKRNAEGTHTVADIKELASQQNGKCACCRVDLKTGHHLDHIMPLAKGGSNDKHNLQLLCQICNLSKGAKDPIMFMQSRGFLL